MPSLELMKYFKDLEITIMVSQSVLLEASAFLLQLSPAGSLQTQKCNKIKSNEKDSINNLLFSLNLYSSKKNKRNETVHFNLDGCF